MEVVETVESLVRGLTTEGNTACVWQGGWLSACWVDLPHASPRLLSLLSAAAVGSGGPLPARNSPVTRGALRWPQQWQAPARSDAERKSSAYQSLDPIVVCVSSAGWKYTACYISSLLTRVSYVRWGSLTPSLLLCLHLHPRPRAFPGDCRAEGSPPAPRGSSSNPTATAALLQKATGLAAQAPQASLLEDWAACPAPLAHGDVSDIYFSVVSKAKSWYPVSAWMLPTREVYYVFFPNILWILDLCLFLLPFLVC